MSLRSTLTDKHQSGDKFLHFVKLYAPFPVLCSYAEQLSFRAPLQSLSNEAENWTDSLFRFLHISNPMYEFVPNRPLDYYTCPFKTSKLDRFLGNSSFILIYRVISDNKQMVVSFCLLTKITKLFAFFGFSDIFSNNNRGISCKTTIG